MNRNKAIREYCLECAGGNTVEVGLCPVFKCTLWQYRTGQDLRSKSYQNRMLRYKETYKEELEVMKQDGYEVEKFFEFETPRKGRNPNLNRSKHGDKVK